MVFYYLTRCNFIGTVASICAPPYPAKDGFALERTGGGISLVNPSIVCCRPTELHDLSRWFLESSRVRLRASHGQLHACTRVPARRGTDDARRFVGWEEGVVSC